MAFFSTLEDILIMRKIPINAKNISIFVMLILMAYGYTGLYIDFYQSIKDKPAEETVEVKYSKKGLYLYPRFEIYVTDSDRPNAVSRERFESIQPGDTINGYMKDGDTFVTEKDIQFDKLLGTPILIILYLALLAYGGS